MERLLDVDARRRVVLGALGRQSDTRYLAHDGEDGTIVLVPAVVMTHRQARFLADPSRAAQLQAAMTQPEKWEALEPDLQAVLSGDDSPVDARVLADRELVDRSTHELESGERVKRRRGNRR